MRRVSSRFRETNKENEPVPPVKVIRRGEHSSTFELKSELKDKPYINWGNWGRERHLRCVDRQLGRYPGYKECGRNGGKNGNFHCESDQTHEGTTTTGKKAVWREAAWGGTSDEKKVGTIERSDFIRRLFICHIAFLNIKSRGCRSTPW